ncbi:hypothetical protein BDN72DRAFT_865284 [Pluteus cervinus]|uniref:Uncharacterized protein n=1 Tax=Pluteus cervinus TaxID=181527 RepID=A0ACD3A144_9AGAR|nr:hypothetical protein BDN72DRAFT_865284 [Pluteus cervinus]
MSPNRWTPDGPQGSAFHELVILPTVAPHLARPYQPPGTTPGEGSGDNFGPNGTDTAPTPPAPNPLFYVQVIISWTERTKSRSARVKTHSESKTAPQQVAVLSTNRPDFISTALSAHGLQGVYQPGPVSGPNMRICYPGQPGGKTKAPVIVDDNGYILFQSQLREYLAMQPRSTLNTLQVYFELDTMEGFKLGRQMPTVQN